MSVRVTGMESLNRNIGKIKKSVGVDVFKALVGGANLVRTTAIKSIQTVSAGRTVQRTREGGGTYLHVVSRPNDPPNTDTGRLVSSIEVEIAKKSAFVGSSLEYAGKLEFGDSRMRARPWLNRAMEGNKTEIQKSIRDAVLKGVRRGGR